MCTYCLFTALNKINIPAIMDRVITIKYTNECKLNIELDICGLQMAEFSRYSEHLSKTSARIIGSEGKLSYSELILWPHSFSLLAALIAHCFASQTPQQEIFFTDSV
mgnify:CR=1 FL=1